MNTLRTAALALTALCVAGCTLVGDNREELSIWGVDAPQPPSAGPAVTWQLVIDEPEAADPLSGPRIVLMPENGAYGVFRGARWNDRAPRLVQTLLLRTFEDSGRIVGVGRTSASVRSHYWLSTELRGFHVDRRSGDELMVVSIGAKLLRCADQQVLAARVFEARTSVAGGGIAAVVAACQQASGEVALALVDWTLAAGEADAASGHPPQH